MLSYSLVKGHDFLKTLYSFQTDAQAHRLTETQTNRRRQKRKKTETTNTVVNAGPPDTECLYYLLDVEGVTLKGSLLPANTKYNNNH